MPITSLAGGLKVSAQCQLHNIELVTAHVFYLSLENGRRARYILTSDIVYRNQMEGMLPSFAVDIAGLFRSVDVSCMANVGDGIFINDYAYMSDPKGDEVFPDYANARHVYARLAGTETPRMPKGGPFWSEDSLQLLKSWIDDGRFLP